MPVSDGQLAVLWDEQRAILGKHIEHAVEIEPFLRLAQLVAGKFKNATLIRPPGTCFGCQVIVSLETRL